MAAGAAVSAVDHVLDAGAGARAFALVRPPGHHAEHGKAMGFCFFNSIAIAAAHARARGLSRVAIVDFDVHHGNGTQWSFYDDPAVLFVSSHQYPYYPGTGAANDIGKGAGAGFTVNLPLSAGATDADYEAAYTRLALPVLEQFRPELVLVSAGFDAHMDDPLAGMRLTSGYFGRLTRAIADVADATSQGRLVAITEGGYDLAGLATSLRASISALEHRRCKRATSRRGRRLAARRQSRRSHRICRSTGSYNGVGSHSLRTVRERLANCPQQMTPDPVIHGRLPPAGTRQEVAAALG